MKLNILSDLHLGFGAMERPVNDADVVVLAGDIARPREAASWAMRFDKPVLYVPGNHEFYGSSIDGALDELKRLCEGTQVHVLDNGEAVIDGVRFLGTTLWTDFELFGDADAAQRPQRTKPRRLLRDFSRIRVREASTRSLHAGRLGGAVPAACGVARFPAGQRPCRPHGGDHAPRAVAPQHPPALRRIRCSTPASCPTPSTCWGAHRAALWIHGHTHDSFDYRRRRHPRRLQPARLCPRRRQREPAVRSGLVRGRVMASTPRVFRTCIVTVVGTHVVFGATYAGARACDNSQSSSACTAGRALDAGLTTTTKARMVSAAPLNGAFSLPLLSSASTSGRRPMATP